MTLLEASNTLVKNQIHRLPVIDQSETNSILHMITHYRILNFLVKNVCVTFSPLCLFLVLFLYIFKIPPLICFIYALILSFPLLISIVQFPSHPLNPILQCTIGSLGIGTYEHVVTVLADTPLIVVLDLLAARKISAVPIVDEHGMHYSLSFALVLFILLLLFLTISPFFCPC
jgi:5'-AMP-activated protein kinase, regulatory gamma subunit